jgi:hypothetical protein
MPSDLAEKGFGGLSAVVDEKRTAYPTDCYTNKISESRISSPTDGLRQLRESPGAQEIISKLVMTGQIPQT